MLVLPPWGPTSGGAGIPPSPGLFPLQLLLRDLLPTYPTHTLEYPFLPLGASVWSPHLSPSRPTGFISAPLCSLCLTLIPLCSPYPPFRVWVPLLRTSSPPPPTGVPLPPYPRFPTLRAPSPFGLSPSPNPQRVPTPLPSPSPWDFPSFFCSHPSSPSGLPPAP